MTREEVCAVGESIFWALGIGLLGAWYWTSVLEVDRKCEFTAAHGKRDTETQPPGAHVN
jgi:hypothetical protein